jgi:hypothetical protein
VFGIQKARLNVGAEAIRRAFDGQLGHGFCLQGRNQSRWDRYTGLGNWRLAPCSLENAAWNTSGTQMTSCLRFIGVVPGATSFAVAYCLVAPSRVMEF